MTMTSIRIEYKFSEGWHVFTSKDVPGMYVASKDAETAYNDVAPSIELLLRLNEGVACKAAPEVSFRQFVESTRSRGKGNATEAVPESLVLTNQRYALCAA